MGTFDGAQPANRWLNKLDVAFDDYQEELSPYYILKMMNVLLEGEATTLINSLSITQLIFIKLDNLAAFVIEDDVVIVKIVLKDR